MTLSCATRPAKNINMTLSYGFTQTYAKLRRDLKYRNTSIQPLVYKGFVQRQLGSQV